MQRPATNKHRLEATDAAVGKVRRWRSAVRGGSNGGGTGPAARQWHSWWSPSKSSLSLSLSSRFRWPIKISKLKLKWGGDETGDKNSVATPFF